MNQCNIDFSGQKKGEKFHFVGRSSLRPQARDSNMGSCQDKSKWCVLMFLLVVTVCFRVLSVDAFSKTKPKYVFFILDGSLIGESTIENPHWDNQMVAVTV